MAEDILPSEQIAECKRVVTYATHYPRVHMLSCYSSTSSANIALSSNSSDILFHSL